MNELTEYIAAEKLDAKMVMNFLQLQGVVSDNCVTAADVAAVDAKRAVWMLRKARGKI